MNIIDLNGFEIEIMDLEGAIKQSDLFTGFQHFPSTQGDTQRQAYWQDLHSKLLKLKAEHNDSKKRK